MGSFEGRTWVTVPAGYDSGPLETLQWLCRSIVPALRWIGWDVVAQAVIVTTILVSLL